MLRKLFQLTGRVLVVVAGILGGACLAIVTIICGLTLTDSWDGSVLWYVSLIFGVLSTLGAKFPPYFLGFLAFMSLFNGDDDQADMPWQLWTSMLGYLLAVLAIPVILLFRIKTVALAASLLTLQYAIIYAYFLYSREV